LKNNNLYNDKEFFDDGDLNWYDYGFRNYDPQIGRFTQLDPLMDDYPELTPYQYASNDPIGNIDVDGLFTNPAQMWQCAGDVLSDGIKIGNAVSIVNAAINIASRVVNNQLNNKTVNQGLSNIGVQKQIADAAYEYYQENKGQMGFLDYLTLGSLANNYFKGLNLMAWWSKGDFLKLNRLIIENVHINDEVKAQLVEAGIIDIQNGFAGIMHEGANTGIFISGLSLFPSVGKGIRAPFKSGTQQSIVNAGSQSLSNSQVRAWYNNQLRGLNTSVEFTEENAMSLYLQRNSLKIRARGMMADREAAKLLEKTDPIRPFKYYVEKYSSQGYSGKSLWERIIQGSSTPNAGVNGRFGIK